MYNKEKNIKTSTTIFFIIGCGYLLAIVILGLFLKEDSYAVNYSQKFLSPTSNHIFGTDFMGRDMFFRCIKGLSNSIFIGLLTSFISSIISLVLGVSSSMIGGIFEKFVLFCIDCCMSIPHLILLILLSFTLGKGAKGVIFGVALTHWPELTRVIRSEVLQIKSAQYVQAAYKMGKTRLEVATTHIFPHIIPVYTVGIIMTFPHTIMHESAVTFLGFGLPAETPAIGIILSEAMQHIATGKWWLAVFPGGMLIVTVLLFYGMGMSLERLMKNVK